MMDTLTILIGGKAWKVEFRKVPRALWQAKNEREIGKCIRDQRLIIVDPGEADAGWTLVHEVAHAALPDLCEEAVERLEAALRAMREAIDTSTAPANFEL